MIRGTDNKGNALHLKICRKQHNATEVWLYVQMGNGSVFLLPEHPDCTFINSHKNTWSGGGLKLQMCEPLRRWRISFNGLLSDIVDIQRDWNTNLKCDAIAREPWRSTTWMEMRKQIGEGYDQWGILHGTWQTFDDVAEVKELYLRGIRQRRYGIDESEWLRRCVNYVGVTADGTMFSVEARSSEKPGLTHALFGHVYRPDGCQKSMDSCDFELPNIGEYPDSIPHHVVLRFTAGGKNYTSTIHTIPHSGAYLHGGRPWNYEALILAFRCSLNTDRAINLGAGTALFWYRYTGTCPPFIPTSVNTLKEPQFKFEAPIPMVLDFKERLCGSMCETVSSEVSKHLQRILAENSPGHFAVRSSAVGEDSEDLSAAGQNATFLGVHGELVDILEAIQKCWASLYTFQSLQYRKMGQIAVKESKCGRKAHRVSLSDEGGITAELTEQDKVSQLCITTTEALALGKLGLQLEQMFGGPRDVEWAISKNVVEEISREIQLQQEVFPGVVTPLSQSITLRSADLATRQGLPYRPGYHYLSSIVTSSHHGKEITIADKVVDLAVYGHLVTSPEFLRLAIERNGYLNSWGKLFIVLKILKDMLLKSRVVRLAKKLSDEFILDYNSHNNSQNLYNSISKSLSTLAKVADCHTYTSRVGLFTQVVAITVLTEGSEELSTEHYGDMGLLLSSCTDVVSAQIPAILEDLAASIVATGRGAIFCKVSPSQAVKWLSENCPIVSIKLTGFLNRHGHRCIKEFELMSETWSMNPEGLMKTLQNMVRNLAGAKSIKQTKKNTTDQELLSQLKSVKKAGTRKVLGWLLSLCRSSVVDREANKDCYITVTQRLRLAYRHLANLMVKEGRIPDPQLLYFFSHYELGLLLRTRDAVIITKIPPTQKKARPTRRCVVCNKNNKRKETVYWCPDCESPLCMDNCFKTYHTNMLKFLLNYYNLLSSYWKLKAETSKGSKANGSHLKGTSVCSGTVMGRACVVLNLDQISQLKHGDILITHSTDVGWSPYFPLLGGVVTELGGLISHGAVVAREYGLPCIVGCQGATTAFATGDTVLLVAGLGTLEKICEGTEATAAS
ncbi:hypothetical protein C0J52_04339 [Blattella germanica]|nr:hypothetical protein C0J52_04339 [Blattella germanica]